MRLAIVFFVLSAWLVLFVTRKTPSRPRSGFLHRQFDGQATEDRIGFDAMFGIILPLFCITFDPIVFKALARRGGEFSEYQVFAYCVMALEMLLLTLWLSWPPRIAAATAFIGGGLLAGGVFAFMLGAILFPLSTLGLLVLWGALGYTPFFTAFVFVRNGAIALRSAQHRIGRRNAVIWAVVGTAVVVVPWVLHRIAAPE